MIRYITTTELNCWEGLINNQLSNYLVDPTMIMQQVKVGYAIAFDKEAYVSVVEEEF